MSQDLGKYNTTLLQFYNELLTVDLKSKSTADTYKIAIEQFLAWCNEKGYSLESINIQNLMYFLAQRKTQADQLTIAKDISALRAFGSFLVQHNIWNENIPMLLERPRAKRSLPRVLSEIGRASCRERVCQYV